MKLKKNTEHQEKQVHYLAMRRLNKMEPRSFTLTKICLLVILLSGSLVQTKKINFKELQSNQPSNIPRTHLRTGTDSSLRPQLRFVIYWNTKTMKEMVCGSKWIKNVLERNLPQRLLPLSNNDINILLWDMVDALSAKLSEDIHWWDSYPTISYYLGSFGFWSNPTEYKPDHEIYDEIWNSFIWRDAKKGFLTSKDALNFISQFHLALQSSRQDAELTMLMDFFDQPLYFDNIPRMKPFPSSKTGDTFLSNFKLPAQIRSLMPRDMSLVKAIEEAQDMVSFDRKELKYNLRVLNVRTLYLQLVNRRCQSFRTTTPATQTIGCGEPLPKARIVGGNIAKQGSWPWMAYLHISKGSGYFSICGGVLISDRHVLTAAHCVIGNPAENVRAYLGEFDLDELVYSSTAEYEYEAEKIFSHELHGNIWEGNDLALIKLKVKVIFNNDRRPICLPPPNITLDGKIAFMAGWGRTTEGGYTSTKLLEAFAPIWADAECKKALWNSNIQNLICMGGNGKVGTCKGDSGGPIMYQTASGQWMVVGIVSWGQGCARVGYPGASVRVSSYLDWINAKLIL